MWRNLSSFVIKNRIVLLITTILFTCFMAWKATELEISYDYVQIIPKEDPEYVFYQNFKSEFGEDGNIFALGMKDKRVFELQNFQKLQSLATELSKIEGIKDVISLPTLKKIDKDTVKNLFVQNYIFPQKITNQYDLDSLIKVSDDQLIYNGLLHNKKTHALLLAVALDAESLNSAKRSSIMDQVFSLTEKFKTDTNIDLYYAGLPYIRTVMVKEMKSELLTLLLLSVVVTSIILFIFFRSLFSVVFTFLVITTTIIITGGTIVLLGYKVTILTGILPALIIIISIPNCIYMYNKYHQEFKKHGNKLRAVSKIIEKIGFLTFMTNINTAVGFYVLYFTDIITIKQFGVCAGTLSVATYLITLIIIPTFLLFMPPPTAKQLKHLDLSFLRKLNIVLETLSLKNRTWVYSVSAFFIIISLYGISKLKTESYMVDDLPEKSSIRTDLAFFEQHFNGVMPLEIIVDLGKPKAIYKTSNLKKLNELEEYLLSFNNISPPLSILNVLKGTSQAFYGGDPAFYQVPSKNEFAFMKRYFGNSDNENKLLKSFVDSTGRYVRFSCKVADLGTTKMNDLVTNNINVKVNEIFDKEGMSVKVTGTTLLFLKGNDYLINDLSESLFYSFILISLMMAFIFTSPKMILISMVPNVIPMMMTAGVMGLFNIPLKPSTALIFGISFGISIDNTVHFLTKYKQELRFYQGNVIMAVKRSLEETGVSMIYTSIVLFSGFIVFVFSNFGGTVALGMLTSMTLFFAMFTNLILLPSLLLTFSSGKHKLIKRVSKKTKLKLLQKKQELSDIEEQEVI